MLFKKLWRTMGLYKGQFISMMIMVAIGIGVFVGFNIEWYTLEVNTNEFFEETNLSDFQLISETGFSEEDFEKVEKMKGIDAASRFVRMKAEVSQQEIKEESDGEHQSDHKEDTEKNSADVILLTAVEEKGVSDFMLISGEEYDPESKDGIWLSEKYALANDLDVGDDFHLKYMGMDFEGSIKGLVKSGEYTVCITDKTQILPDFENNGFAYISPLMYEDVVGMDFYPQINVLTDLEKAEFTDEVNEIFDETILILSKDENVSYAGPRGEIDEGKTMALILPTLFLMIAILTMVSTMNRLAAKEKIQIGTFKALGLKDRKILLHYSCYSLFIGIIGTILGVLLGYAVAYGIINPVDGAMTIYIDMPSWAFKIPTYCIVTLFVIIALLTLIGYLSVKQMLKGTAAEALRPYSPKKMKPLLIEKTKFFHKLPFGIRWNMRDTARHKARSAMSIFGTIGCTMILVACLGLQDTVNLMYDRYYGDDLKYESRIFCENGENLIDEYEGDGAASISVQLDDEALSLDIYDLRNEILSFANENMETTMIDGEGAYICKRIAEDHELKLGDSFTVSPYGSEEEYELKVAGVISSFNKGIAITSDYAKEKDIPYSIDSVYTKTKEKDIEKTEQILSIQSKEVVLDAYYSMASVMDSMIVLLLAAGIILGVIVLYNLGVMSYTERYRELATLKVVGFKDRKIASLLNSQNFAVAVAGIILGIPSGLGAIKVLMDQLAPEYELTIYISPLSYCISILLTFGVTMVVSFMLSRKNKKINMVEALKNDD